MYASRKGVPNIKDECGSYLSLPHIAKVGYVGLETACEIVEAWYRLAVDKSRVFEIETLQHMHNMIVRDGLFLGLNPVNLLRELTLDLNLTDTVLPFCTREGCLPERERYIASLLKIKKKKVFKLTIILWQRQIQLNMWPKGLELFREVIESL